MLEVDLDAGRRGQPGQEDAVTKRVAIIGAGIAGLACARELRRAGAYVDVFERERNIGGRISTTRLGLTPFDHGSQYLTARGDRFTSYLKELMQSGYAARWTPSSAAPGGGQLSPWYVGTPGMSAIVRPLTESVRIHTGRVVHTIARTDGSWHLWFDDQTSTGPFNSVVIATPAPEARLLLGSVPDFVDRMAQVRMQPCWAILFKLDQRVFPDQDAYSDMSDVVRWIGRNNSKPGRTPGGDHIVVHASPKWSRETEDAESDDVAQEMWSEISNLLNLPPMRPNQMSAVLWRHGLVDTSLGESCMYSSQLDVGVCGDWCLGRLAEHAFESGIAVARAINA